MGGGGGQRKGERRGGARARVSGEGGDRCMGVGQYGGGNGAFDRARGVSHVEVPG